MDAKKRIERATEKNIPPDDVPDEMDDFIDRMAADMEVIDDDADPSGPTE